MGEGTEREREEVAPELSMSPVRVVCNCRDCLGWGFCRLEKPRSLKILSSRRLGEGNRSDVEGLSMGDDGAAGLRPAAPSNPAIREISKVLEPMLTSMRERDASRSSKSSPDNAVRPTILQR